MALIAGGGGGIGPRVNENLDLIAGWSAPPPPPPPPPAPLVLAQVETPAPIRPAPLAVPEDPVVPSFLTTRFADAQIALDAALAERDSLPSAIAHYATPAVERARAELTTTEQIIRNRVTGEAREQAQTITPTIEQDIYSELRANALANEMPAAAQAPYEAIVNESLIEAVTADPVNVSEAGWQRNWAIWTAQDADFALAQAEQALIDLPSNVPDSAQQAAQEQAAVARIMADASWQRVEQTFATEYRLVADQNRPLSLTIDPVSEHRRQILAQGFDPAFANRIRLAAQTAPAPREIPALTEEQIDATVVGYVDRVEQAWLDGGNEAALNELLAINEQIIDDPILSVGGASNAPNVQAERFITVQTQLQEALAPIYERITQEAPDHLFEVRQDAEFTEVALDVSEMLLLYSEALPPVDFSTVMTENRDLWTAVITEDYRREVQYTSTAQTDATQNFALIADSLALNHGDYWMVQEMGQAFASLWVPDLETDSALWIPNSFDSMLQDGRGFYLAIETANGLNPKDPSDPNYLEIPYDGTAEMFVEMIGRHVDRMTQSASNRIIEQAEGREEFYRIVSEFSDVNAMPSNRAFEPGSIDVGSMELENALVEYVDTNPEFQESDAALTAEIALDGQQLMHARLALEMLDESLSATENGQEVIDRLNQFWMTDPANGGYGAAYAQSAPLLADASALLAQIEDIESLAGAVDGATLQSPAQALFGLTGKRLLGNVQADGKLFALGMIGSYVLYGRSQLEVATDEDASLAQRTLAGVNTGRFGLQAGREIWKLNYELTRFNAVLDANEYMQTHAPRTFHVLNSGMGALAVATDTANLIRVGVDIQRGTEGHFSNDSLIQYGLAGLNLTANSLFLGSTLYQTAGVRFGGSALAASLFGTGGWAGPIAWGMFAVGGLAQWQYSRVQASNEFETANIRQALAHIGSLGDDGNLRPIVEMSEFKDHNPDVMPYVLGMETDGLIAYRGISANAVDELLNNSSDPKDPQSSLDVLSVLAQQNGMTGRELIMSWYDGLLSNDEQKELPPAAFGVDLDATGFSDESLRDVWRTHPTWIQDVLTTAAIAEIDEDLVRATIDYIYENDVIFSYSDDFGNLITELDTDRLRPMLGLGELQPGQSPVPADVRDGATAIMAGFNIQSGYRPDSLDGLNYWLSLNQYPPITPRTAVAPQVPVRPEVAPIQMVEPEVTTELEPTTPPTDPSDLTDPVDSIDPVTPTETADEPPQIDTVQPEPELVAYVVKSGDTLWALAGPNANMEEVQALIELHNRRARERGGDSIVFDPTQIDGQFDRNVSNENRDPDLIRPGEVIYLSNP
ncbi:MAG: hypothetical protein AB8C46_07815 [Burkholderiaceae bacterium]